MAIKARYLIAATVAAWAVAGEASANDATAELGAGGLALVYNNAVEMRSEELYVSADEIRVRYRFHNVTDTPYVATVAFPLPTLDASLIEMMYVLPHPDDENYVGFEVTIDGKPVTPSLYARASALGVDRTQMLADAGVPLLPAGEETFAALAALPPETLDTLRQAGLIVAEDWGIFPAWLFDAAYYWEQTFPPGEDVVVEHRYQPVVGYGFFGEWSIEDAVYRERYCMDDDFIAAARRMLAREGGDYPMLNERRIEYVLTTANTWASPIRDFRLTVDKGSADALVSFCGEGVTREGDTTFVDTETDFAPQRELDVLIITPLAD